MPSASSPADLHIANDLRPAAQDLQDATLLRTPKSRNSACHTEQALEKLLLALLVSEQIHVPARESHQLDILVDKLPVDHPMRERLKRLAFLTVYATAFRYPKTGGRLPTVSNWADIDQAIASIGELIKEACDHFGVDLARGDNVPARISDPIRPSDGRPALRTDQ